MSQETCPPLEATLRLCAAAAPAPWYPRLHARQTAADGELLLDLLESLWLEGLVRKTAGTAESGTGALLTPLGEQVVADPALMDRLRRGLPVRPNDPGAVVRNSLRSDVRPLATWALIAVNVAVFLYGAWLAAQPPRQLVGYLFMGFLSPPAAPTEQGVDPARQKAVEVEYTTRVRNYFALLHTLGAADAGTVRSGEWWRLLTTTFVHGGPLHLALNLFTLFGAGAFVERTWGRWRLLVIYLLSAWGGSCLAIACTPQAGVVGASGAICGLLAAEAVWVLLYGKYLPPALARQGRSQVFMTLLLMIFISVLPLISGWGHLGGAMTGALAALVLHGQRFGRPVFRWAAVLLLLPLPLLSYAHLRSTWTDGNLPGPQGPQQTRATAGAGRGWPTEYRGGGWPSRASAGIMRQQRSRSPGNAP
jgi:rhomboid protease GluP